MKQLITQDWYKSLLEDISSTLTERVHNAREEVITAYWEVGKRIAEEKRLTEYGKGVMAKLAKDLDCSISSLYHAVKFFEIAPKLEEWLSTKSKNLSWYKIVHQELSPGHKNKKEICGLLHCAICGKNIKHEKNAT